MPDIRHSPESLEPSLMDSDASWTPEDFSITESASPPPTSPPPAARRGSAPRGASLAVIIFATVGLIGVSASGLLGYRLHQEQQRHQGLASAYNRLGEKLKNSRADYQSLQLTMGRLRAENRQLQQGGSGNIELSKPAVPTTLTEESTKLKSENQRLQAALTLKIQQLSALDQLRLELARLRSWKQSQRSQQRSMLARISQLTTHNIQLSEQLASHTPSQSKTSDPKTHVVARPENEKNRGWRSLPIQPDGTQP